LIRSHLENSQSSAAPTVTDEDLEQLHDENDLRDDRGEGGEEDYVDDGFVNEAGGRRGDGEERDLDEDVEEI
jgi:hypothetical protein